MGLISFLNEYENYLTRTSGQARAGRTENVICKVVTLQEMWGCLRDEDVGEMHERFLGT